LKSLILNEDWFEKFTNYAIRHGKAHDESFTSKNDMERFVLGGKNPTLLIVDDEEQEILGAASLIYHSYFLRGNRSRLRLFHCLKDNPDWKQAYETLTAFVKEELVQAQLDHAFLFMPLKEKETIKFFESLDFQVERYTLYMERSTQNVKPFTFPQKMHLKDFSIGKDETTWLEIRNKAFSNLTGNDTPLSLEEFTKFISGSDYVDGGMKILYDEDQPVGIICLSESDDEETGNRIGTIGPIAVKEGYRHQKLGRNLLRTGLAIAKEKGFSKVGLSVDTQNINAKTLYTDEGFQEMLSLVCLRIK